MSNVRTMLGLGLGAMLIVACGGTPAASPTPAPTPTPVVTPSPPAATPTPAPTQSPSGVIVTFRVEQEQFKILVTDAALIAHVEELFAGGEEGRIPSGLIVRGVAGDNAPWSWHIDPGSLEFADMTMEICDGLPSHVEDGTLEGERYCPWGAQVIDVSPAG